MNTLGDRLRELRNQKGLNIREAAENLDVNKNTLSRYENNKRKPDSEFIEKAANYYNVNTDYLLGRVNFRDKLPENAQIINPDDMVKIPIVGCVSCGIPLLAEENIIGYELVDKNSINGGTYFYLKAQGDSMVGARIYEGDLVLVRQQEDIENGEIAVVMVNDEATLKRIYKTDNKIILQPENPRYKPIQLCEGNVRIIGKVVEVKFKFE
ncbi:repressor LexA [Orenia metallireducens]|jgi:repressor LexA|uniref:Repressor LexA n=1 Tax=Orenia metallireducens TaxID=1413210 RepID=A0A1C0ADB8_9FIRM|nr:transcriptional repressor LexA [Orenia metallireducens]OCL28635.1 repressor LexA [Orenia metallireducens]